MLGRALPDGSSREVQQGTLSDVKEHEAALVFPLDLGKRRFGVWTLALRLRANSQVVETRQREPLVVVRRHVTRLPPNAEGLDGLNVELEDRIDFTNPGDPHPWIEAEAALRLTEAGTDIQEPTIVRKDGLVYREVTGETRGSFFSYRFAFKHPGDFYVFELEYPDDADRIIEVCICDKQPGLWSNSQSGTGAETGGRYFKTGTMHTLRWLHVADPGPHSIDIMNCESGRRAAARAVRIYHVKGELPGAVIGQGRWHGIHSERCYPTSGIGMNFGVESPHHPGRNLYATDPRPAMQRFIQDLVWWLDTADRYAQYLRFAGENMHIMGAYQYTELNTPLLPHPYPQSTRVPPSLHGLLANVLDVNNIAIYAGMEFCQFKSLAPLCNDGQVARGTNTLWLVNGTGIQNFARKPATTLMNWMHPVVRDELRYTMRNWVSTLGHLSSFRGVHMTARLAGREPPGLGTNPADGHDYSRPYSYTYDDTSFRQFEQSTGTRLPIEDSDPERFQKRHRLAALPSFRNRFTRWRCDAFASFCEDLLGTLHDSRPDLQLLVAPVLAFRNIFVAWEQRGTPFPDFLKAYGIDLDRLARAENLVTGRWNVNWVFWQHAFHQDPYMLAARTDPAIINAFDRPANRFMFLRTSWDESFTVTGGHALESYHTAPKRLRDDWIMTHNRVRAIPQPGGRHTTETMTQALVTGDPKILVTAFTDLNINVGFEGKVGSV